MGLLGSVPIDDEFERGEIPFSFFIQHEEFQMGMSTGVPGAIL